MPTYQHHCTNEQCNHDFELFYGITEDPPTECPKCHQQTAQRVIASGGSFVLTGGGWSSDSYSGGSNHK